jgi:hypothetical protein
MISFVLPALIAISNILIFVCLLLGIYSVAIHDVEQKRMLENLFESHQALSEKLNDIQSSSHRTNIVERDRGILKRLFRIFGSKASAQTSGDNDRELMSILQILAEKNHTCTLPHPFSLKEEQWISECLSFVLLAAGFTVLFRMAYSEYVAFQHMKDDEEVERVNGKRQHAVTIGEFIKYRYQLSQCS